MDPVVRFMLMKEKLGVVMSAVMISGTVTLVPLNGGIVSVPWVLKLTVRLPVSVTGSLKVKMKLTVCPVVTTPEVSEVTLVIDANGSSSVSVQASLFGSVVKPEKKRRFPIAWNEVGLELTPASSGMNFVPNGRPSV